MVIRRLIQRRARTLSFWFLAAAAGGVAACDDPIGLQAGIGTLTDTFTVFALSGTPTSVPVALSTTDRIAVRMADNLAFDVAFDLDASGSIKAFPVRQIVPFRVIAGLLQPSHRVGLQKATTTFDNLTRAPSGGYNYDSVTVVRAGETLIVEVQATQCSFSFSPNLYTKIAIDSVFASSRSIRIRTVHDPNCGFRSFKPGIPKD
ncbi:MAG TPA: hypothetical protein VGQ52_08380 [Gemmatimonadaceae bacterium]|jgi:hypothetical protein|nr:hypothetical protein [Gemmatimonadaceae bacterium]